MMEEQNNSNEQPAPLTQEEKSPQKSCSQTGRNCLFIGTFITILAICLHIVGDMLPQPQNALVKLFYLPYYISLFFCFLILIAGTIICTISLKSILAKKDHSQMALSAIGMILCILPLMCYSVFPPLATQEKTYPEHENAEITINERHECTSSVDRERHYKEYAALHDEPVSQRRDIAEDIACAYIEYAYHNDKEPDSIEDLLDYFKLPEAKNGTVSILINDDNIPHEDDIYNLTTHKTCNGYSDGAISIWYYDVSGGNAFEKLHPSRICLSFSAEDENANIYDTNSDNYVQLSY